MISGTIKQIQNLIYRWKIIYKKCPKIIVFFFNCIVNLSITNLTYPVSNNGTPLGA